MGAVVCHDIERGSDPDSIASEVATKYAVDLATVKRDVSALIAELRKEGLVEPHPGA